MLVVLPLCFVLVDLQKMVKVGTFFCIISKPVSILGGVWLCILFLQTVLLPFYILVSIISTFFLQQYNIVSSCIMVQLQLATILHVFQKKNLHNAGLPEAKTKWQSEKEELAPLF